MANFGHRTYQNAVPVGARALQSGVWGPQHPYPQITLPRGLTEHAPRTVFFVVAILARFGLKIYIAQGSSNIRNQPKSRTCPKFSTRLEPQRKIDNSMFSVIFDPQIGPCHPQDPGLEQPNARPKMRPGSKTRLRRCVSAILRGGNPQRCRVAPQSSAVGLAIQAT